MIQLVNKIRKTRKINLEAWKPLNGRKGNTLDKTINEEKG